jgi:predicted TIM-barrel fold metal-dependent hydrolase
VTVVDGHLHVFLKQSARYPRDTHVLFPSDREAPVERLLEAMETAGVDKAVLVPLSRHDEYLHECLERYPGTFVGVGIDDPAADDRVGEFRRRAETVPLQGLRMFALGDPDVSDPEQLHAFPLLAALAEGGYKLWYYPPPAELPLLARVLERLPQLVVCLNHLGFCQSGFEADELGRPRIPTELPPATLDAMLGLARFPGVHVMFSGEYAFSKLPYPYDDMRGIVRSVYDAFGADRMFRASDFPWILEEPGYAETLALTDEYLPDISSEERAAIRGGTALRLFSF